MSDLKWQMAILIALALNETDSVANLDGSLN